MNTFWTKLKRLTPRHSRRRNLAQEATALFRKAPEDSVYTLGLLLQKLDVTSTEELASVLADLTHKGVVDKIVRLDSPSKSGGIGDYSSVTEVPSEVFDWRADRTIRVRPENITILFRPSRRHGRRA